MRNLNNDKHCNNCKNEFGNGNLFCSYCGNIVSSNVIGSKNINNDRNDSEGCLEKSISR